MNSIVATLLLLSFAFSTGKKIDACAERAQHPHHTVCTLFPESMEGPYYVEDIDVRSNITEGKPGAPLQLSITVVNFTTCEALPNIPVDIWQCDADGEYSSFIGVTLKPGLDPEGDDGYHGTHWDNKTFLRGVQYTNPEGQVTFHTLFPGWYPGRTIHIHVMAHINNIEHTGQLYFDQDLQDLIAMTNPYSENDNIRITNVEDFIYNGADGPATTLHLVPTGRGGYQTSILMGIGVSK